MTSMEPLYSPSVIRRLLRRYDIRPKKGLGQNFLADGNIVARIVDAAFLEPEEAVVEIGPGLGSLTQGLLKAGAKVLAIEKDAQLVAALQELFPKHPRLRIVHADARFVDYPSAFLNAFSSSPPCSGSSSIGGATTSASSDSISGVDLKYKIVANLPYSVTSPLLMGMLEYPLPPTRAVVMIQREVADRIMAEPGSKEYGALTVGVRFRAEVEKVALVPPTVFVPAPKVASQVIALTPRPSPWDVGDEKVFSALVKAAFGQRRKALRNALRPLGISPDLLSRAFMEAEIDPTRRGETLSLAEFARLSHILSRASIML